MNNNFTGRTELKYSLDKATFDKFIKECGDNLIPDEYGVQNVYNIFFEYDRRFDCPSFVSQYKEHLRLRAYEKNGKLNDYFYAELKNRVDDVVYKRRIKLPIKELDAVLNGTYKWGNSQIEREIEWFITRHKQKPYYFSSYKRFAYSTRDKQSMRITIDCEIKGRTENLKFSHDKKDIDMKAGYIMELKTQIPLPKWYRDVINNNGLCNQKGLGKRKNVMLKLMMGGKKSA